MLGIRIRSAEKGHSVSIENAEIRRAQTYRFQGCQLLAADDHKPLSVIFCTVALIPCVSGRMILEVHKGIVANANGRHAT